MKWDDAMTMGGFQIR